MFGTHVITLILLALAEPGSTELVCRPDLQNATPKLLPLTTGRGPHFVDLRKHCVVTFSIQAKPSECNAVISLEQAASGCVRTCAQGLPLVTMGCIVHVPGSCTAAQQCSSAAAPARNLKTPHNC